jgi:hypothetical protein
MIDRRRRYVVEFQDWVSCEAEVAHVWLATLGNRAQTKMERGAQKIRTALTFLGFDMSDSCNLAPLVWHALQASVCDRKRLMMKN